MAKYTWEIWELEDGGVDFISELQDFPIFNETYRIELITKIINHYRYEYNIEAETWEYFLYKFKIKMNEIMPYYNQRYESELLEVNPLLSFSRSRTEDSVGNTVENKDESLDMVDNVSSNSSKNKSSTKDENSTIDGSTNTSTDKNMSEDVEITNQSNGSTVDDISEALKEKNVGSDTPTEQLLIGDIENNLYASKANINDTERSNNSTRTTNDNQSESKQGNRQDNVNEVSNNSQELNIDTVANENETAEDSTEKTQNVDKTMNNTVTENKNNIITENGFEIPLSDLLVKYRKTFLNIDMEVIRELRVLFMKVW